MRALLTKIGIAAIIAAFAVASTDLSVLGAESKKVSWYQAWYFKFKPGKADEALKIIQDHFVEVDKKIGRKVIPFNFQSGEWDHVVFFPSVLNPDRIDTIPSEEKWFAALAEQEGGMEKAQELLQRFFGLVVNFKKEIAQTVPAPWLP